jgi:hypothetical protein
VKSDFRQFGFRLVLFLWFTLTGIKSDANEATGSASASVVSPISVNRALLDLEGVAFISEVTGSRRIIGIARALPTSEASGGGTNAVGYFALVDDSGFAHVTLADFTKRAAGQGTLSGDIVNAVTINTPSVTGFVSVTVAYN